MWFKNIRAYRLTSPFELSAESLGEKLAQRAFEPCAKSQALSLGWVAPLGDESEQLAHSAGGRLLIKLKREEKLLPSTVVREQLEDKVALIESEQARKVYRKERLTLKDEIIQDCLPRAFSRSSAVFGRFTDDIQNSDPDQALGWITGRYEQLVSSCSAS